MPLADPWSWRASALRRRREMMPIYGWPRLRGTAALQASIEHRCDERMAIIGRFPGGRPLRRRRENDANLRPATAARDRSPPGLQSISAATNEWPLLAIPWASAPSAP